MNEALGEGILAAMPEVITLNPAADIWIDSIGKARLLHEVRRQLAIETVDGKPAAPGQHLQWLHCPADEILPFPTSGASAA